MYKTTVTPSQPPMRGVFDWRYIILSIKIISRGKGGKSAVAAAAYRAGDRFINEYNGKTYDYTNKPGVIHTEILLPDHAPREYADRSTLWNAVGTSRPKLLPKQQPNKTK